MRRNTLLVTRRQIGLVLRQFHSSPSSFRKEKRLVMPKSHGNNVERFRQKLKVQGQRNVVSGNVSMEVLGTGAYGAPTCLYMYTPCKIYLFNCGEGTQRAANEHRVKLTKLEHVFLTSASWKNLGGLPGLTLTLQGIGIQQIKVHGPKDVVNLFDHISNFVAVDGVKISQEKCEEPYKDRDMCIQYVPIQKSSGKSNEKGNSESSSEINENGKRTADTDTESGTKIRRTEEIIADTMCYICRLNPYPGRLSLEKCVDRGVPPGPLLGLLKAGEDITLENGTVVRSKEVCDPLVPGIVFLVVECPTENHLDSFVDNPAFAKHQSTAAEETDMAYCVFHFTPSEIVDHPKYRQWMEKFSTETRHVMVNEKNRCLGSEAIYKQQYQLNMLHPELFPLFNTECFEKKKENDQLVQCAQTLDKFIFRPKKFFTAERAITLQPEVYKQMAMCAEGFPETLEKLRKDIAEKSKGLKGKEYPKVLMLGTGSAIPSKLRNTSGILIRMNEESSILLDCGENTLGQIVRFFGATESPRILSTIKAIYVSHLHADHHIGFINIIQMRARATNKPVYLLAPEQIMTWLKSYHEQFEPILDKFALIPNRLLRMDNYKCMPLLANDIRAQLNVLEIKTVPVRHCPNAFGVSITVLTGEKIVYSGDATPCQSLINLGMDCDLLIHEATMEDGMEKEAETKLHSTASQAILSGQKMGAKFILLTHFSQRYSKIPRLLENNQLDNVGTAYDYLQFSLYQLPILPLFYPSLKLLFNEYYVILEERAKRREQVNN